MLTIKEKETITVVIGKSEFPYKKYKEIAIRDGVQVTKKLSLSHISEELGDLVSKCNLNKLVDSINNYDYYSYSADWCYVLDSKIVELGDVVLVSNECNAIFILSHRLLKEIVLKED